MGGLPEIVGNGKPVLVFIGITLDDDVLATEENRGLNVGPSKVGFGVYPVNVPSTVKIIGTIVGPSAPTSVETRTPEVIVVADCVNVKS